MKGQAAVMDALIFMMIASGAATLLLFVSGLYASSTNGQIMTIYNYEYGGNALIALHYAKDSKGKWFWNDLKDKLIYTDQQTVKEYLDQDAKSVWQNITYSSPAGENTFLCFEGGGTDFCYPQDPPSEFASMTIYTSSVKISAIPDITVILKLYY